MLKMEVSPDREIVITMTKQEAARLNDEMNDLGEIIRATRIVPGGSPFMAIKEKLVDALFQAMRSSDYAGEVK